MIRTARHVCLCAVVLLAGSASAQERVSLPALVARFEQTTVFWQQFEVAKQLVRAGDRSVLTTLAPWLAHQDRHIKGNAAFVFAGLGDSRGLATIREILGDLSDRPLGQGIPGGNLNTRPNGWEPRQVLADRYYAVHLLGELKQPDAVPMLVPLLEDRAVNYHVAWALGQIGDRRAVPALMSSLGNPVALMRVSAIQALETLRATDALPQLKMMLDDREYPSAGPRVTVGETARRAIATLQKER